MARFLWLLGTIVVGMAIAVGSWFGVRQLTHTVQAAPPVEETLLAQNATNRQAQPTPRTTPRPPAGNFNDSEAPPDNSRPEPPKTFIGALRDALDGATDLDMDKDEYLKTLDDAEARYQRIKEENRAALASVNRRPPISIPQSPNFVVIDVPGLGYNDLAAYSPDAPVDRNLTAIAENGLVFTRYYAASASPSANSCSLLTGLHSGRTRIRGEEPVVPLALDDVTVAEVLWRAGYSTCMVGQWRLGGADSSGSPLRQGFDEAWYTSGLNDDAAPVVWRDDRRVADDQQPEDWSGFRTECVDQAIGFFNRHRQQPVFVYLSLPVNVADREDALGQVDDQLGRLTQAVDEMNLARETYFVLAGFPGENVSESAIPAEEPREEGQIPNAPPEDAETPPANPPVEVPAQNQSPRIIPGARPPKRLPAPLNKVIETDFSKSEGQIPEPPPEEIAEKEAESADVIQIKKREAVQLQTVREVAGLRGSLGEMYEGGLRAPLIIWTTNRPMQCVIHEVVAAWDILPTLARLSYAQFIPNYINGATFASVLRGDGDKVHLPMHTALYWESHGDTFTRAFLYGKWKLIQVGEDGPVELYNLAVDPLETQDVSDQQSELVDKLLPLLDLVRSESRNWPGPVAPRAAE